MTRRGSGGGLRAWARAKGTARGEGSRSGRRRGHGTVIAHVRRCATSTRPRGHRRPCSNDSSATARADPAVAARIPPGQYKTEKFPVLHYGSVPHTDLATWDFKVWGEVDSPFTLTWDAVQGPAAQDRSTRTSTA